jgi:hypothetical protein
LIRRLKLFWSLTADDRLILLQAVVLPGLVWTGFRTVGVPRTQAVLRRWGLGARAQRLPDSDARLRIHSARRAQRIIRRRLGIGGNCLVRSLTLWAILMRRGVATDLRIGFRKRDEKIQGHAWLEYASSPINETLDEARSYTPYEQPITFDLWRQIRRSLLSKQQ